MSQLILTDSAIERALAPGIEVVAPFGFTDQVAEAIARQPRRSALSFPLWGSWPRPAARVSQLLLLLLILVLLLGAIVAGSVLPRRGFTNGHVIAVDSVGTTLLDIDPLTGTTRPLLILQDGIPGASIFGVTRSVDGAFISFWRGTAGDNALEVVNSDGSHLRRVATNLVPIPIGQRQIDVWSLDGRYLAAGVLVDGVGRILVVDVESGNGQIVGPIGAANPLWSPDGQLLAFTYDPGPGTVLAVMHPDGSGVREISGDLGGFTVSGTNNWSPDGVWISFGAERYGFAESHIYRANVAEGRSEQLTTGILSAASALSPDGTQVLYSDWPNGRGTQNLMIMDADGGNQRLLLASALNDGWSNDGQFVLAEWRPSGRAYELLVIRPDGTDRQTLMTFDGGCRGACAPNLGWGQPRP